MTAVKKIPQKLCHDAGMIRHYFHGHKKIKIVSVSLIFLFALLYSFSHACFQVFPERLQLTNAIKKDNHPVSLTIQDHSFLSLSNRDQETVIAWLRNKIIPDELRQQFGSNLIIDKLIYLEKNSLMFAVLENVFFDYQKKQEINSTIGLGIPVLISIVILIARRKIFMKDWLKNLLILSCIMVEMNYFSAQRIYFSANERTFQFYGTIYAGPVYIATAKYIFLFLLGIFGFEAGIVYVIVFLSTLSVDIFLMITSSQFNALLPFRFSGIGGAGLHDGVFLEPLKGFIIVSLGWLIRRTVLWGKRKYLMISKRRSDRTLAS